MGRTRTRDTYTYCAYHGVNRGHNSAECKAISQQFAKYNDIFYEFLQTRGLGPYETGRGGRGHKSSWLHPSYGRGRGRAEGVGQFPPYNSPPNFPPDVPRGRFPNGPRHALSANYSYGPGNMEYSGWGAATGHWSTPPEGAHGHGLGGYERSFGGEVGGRYGSGHPPDHGDYFQQPRPGERPYGDDGGRYSFGHPPYDGGSFKQERETTGENYNYGLSAAWPEAPDPRLYGVGCDIPADSRTPQQQQQHQHQQNATWAPLPQSGGGDAVPLPRLHRPHWEYYSSEASF